MNIRVQKKKFKRQNPNTFSTVLSKVKNEMAKKVVQQDIRIHFKMINPVTRKIFSMFLRMFKFLQFSRIKIRLLSHSLYDVKTSLKEANLVKEASPFKIGSSKLLYNVLLWSYNSLKYWQYFIVMLLFAHTHRCNCRLWSEEITIEKFNEFRSISLPSIINKQYEDTDLTM